MKNHMVLPLMGMVSLLWTVGTRADEVSDLKKQVEQQEKQISDLKLKVDQIEAAKKAGAQASVDKPDAADKKAGDKADKKNSALPDSLKWAQNVNWSGDFRYRHDWIEQTPEDRHRDRIRARLKVGASVTEDWDLGFRIRAGESRDPVSGNVTLDDSAAPKTAYLDQAYANWHPGAWKGFSGLAGKFETPFYKAGRNQLIWDDDLTMEGLAASYVLAVGKQTKVHAAMGGFWVEERASADDTMLYGLQGYVQQAMGGPTSLIVGVSHYNYDSIRGHPDLAKSWSGSSNFFGNGNSGGVFTNGYSLLEGFAEFTCKVAKWPVGVFGTVVRNLGVKAENSEDTAWLVGCRLNQAVDPGTWEFNYDYRNIENDAVVGQFCDNEFGGGGTGSKGSRFNFAYQIAKNVQGAVTYYDSTITRSAPEMDYHRLQVDLVVRFK